MSLILYLIIGGVIGWLASLAVGTNSGIIASVVIGVVGSIIGSFLAQAIFKTAFGVLTVPGFICAIVGSIIFLLIASFVSKRR